MNRRQLLKTISLGSIAMAFQNNSFAKNKARVKPIVISTWYNQNAANIKAWEVLNNNGLAIDAVEQGVMISENDWGNCCVGLGGNPDRNGIVTLDACIMNHKHQIGSVAALERIKNPIKIARVLMEETNHVFLAGQGAQDFAVSLGYELKENKLSDHAQDAFDQWKIKNEFIPIINIEKGQHGPFLNEMADPTNHDTIGMIAMDIHGNLSGACTTSGMAFKMHGRVGDSPIIGAGLYVDNEIGAAAATGQGEEVIRICGSYLVVEFMRQGYAPEMACKKAIQRLKEKTNRNLKELQIGFIALNKNGEYGGYSLQKGFDFTVHQKNELNKKVVSKSLV
jgi:N4-(beta-N-acetylglucosaminyl)-L-asparaginase